MNKIKPFFALFIFVSIVLSAQTEIVFGYDEAGNQIFRKLDISNKFTSERTAIITNKKDKTIDKIYFWSKIRIYPVPVKDILTIQWSKEINDFIANVSIFEHHSIHWKFQEKNIPALNQQIKVNMSNYYMGVYVLTFKLKDGRRLSKNITKL